MNCLSSTHTHGTHSYVPYTHMHTDWNNQHVIKYFNSEGFLYDILKIIGLFKIISKIIYTDLEN